MDKFCLHLPISIDLTIHMDVERQSGPDINDRVRDCLLHRYSNTTLVSDVSTYQERNSRHAFFRNSAINTGHLRHPSTHAYAHSQFK